MSFPISEATPLRFAPTLPKACDVVVLGGGVIGVMTAWYLAELGQRVEAHALHLAGFQQRQIGFGHADCGGQVARLHLAPGQHDIEGDNDRH